jgi:CO dehydrogenase nickel-insertion accessory protein CooC1
MDKLGNLRDNVIGSISYDQALITTGLSGHALGECRALEELGVIVDRLEQALASRGAAQG